MTILKPAYAPVGLIVLVFMVGIFAQGCADKENPPVLRLIGPDTVTLFQGEPYLDRWVIAFDREDLDLADQVEVFQGINTDVFGFQEQIYRVTDRHGNVGEISRTVYVYPSARSFEGDFTATTNGFTCSADGLTSHISPYGGLPDKMLISPVVGTGNSGLIMRFEDERWKFESANNLPCNVNILDADCRLSAGGDTVIVLINESFFPGYFSLIYVRQ